MIFTSTRTTQMKQTKPNPIVEHALVTPIDINHPWFGHECRVSHELDEKFVMVQQGTNASNHIRFAKRDLAHVNDRSAVGIARSIGRQLSRRKT